MHKQPKTLAVTRKTHCSQKKTNRTRPGFLKENRRKEEIRMISNKDQTNMVSKTQEKETQKKEDSVMEEQKKAKKNTADIQRNGFQLTINNPEDHGLGHTAL